LIPYTKKENSRTKSLHIKTQEMHSKDTLEFIHSELLKITNREIEILKIEEKLRQEKMTLIDQKKNLLKTLADLALPQDQNNDAL